MNLKIAILLILVSGANILGAVSYSQSETITLNMEKATLQQVMDEIERQSNLFFIFNQKQIDVDRMVDVPKDHTLINEVLPDLLVDTDIKYAIVDNKILLTTDPRRENILTSVSVDEPLQINITGTITDASTSEPMPGVNIHVSGTTLGTISDINGNYSLSVPNLNAVLVFSFVGYESQEIAVAGRSVVNVSLSSEVKGLEEVVVIGYGTQKKETLTGSVAQIQADEIQATKATSVASSIQGKVVGVQIRQQSAEPGVYSSLISIRGFGAPLLVIDGVVRDGMEDFEKLNPSDIETMSVLKDASAAIYGMNADNGVIIITTKKGSTEGKTTFTYSGIHSSKQPTTTKRQSNVDAYTLRVLNNEMLKQTKMPLATSESELEKWKAGTEPGYRDFNWIEEAVRDWTHSQQHNLSVSGGNKNLSFYSSFGYMKDEGLFMDLSLQGYDKYNFRTNVDATLAKGFTSRISFSGRWEDRITPPGTYFWIFKEAIVGDRGVEPFTLANNGHYSLVPADNRNAFASMNRDVVGYIMDKTLQYQTTVDLNYEIPFVKGLSLGVLLGYDGQLADNRRFNKAYRMYDFRTDEPGPLGLSDFTQNLTNFTRKNLQSKITYQTNIGQAHNISATLVNDIRKYNTNFITGKRQYDDVYTHDILDQGSLTNQQTGGYRTEEAYISYLGRFNYDYKSKYLIEFSFREDGTYRYAPSKRWAFFPAFSLGWRVGQENFIKNNLPFITDLKIRASWGKMGRDVGRAFEYYEGYSFSNVDGGYVFYDGVLSMGMVSPGVVNDNLTWISTTTTDIGFDLELFRGKFGLTFDVFKKLSEGELATRITSVPNTFGATFPQENLNSNEIKGIEL
ncbi:MAG: SusC/RagA family TonB-linked outer membrane protein, partial [Bacteroidales bacterium]|nr:SusC/RagA family TonB-linked outer membrane protein [Bacteroidales bacterium]